MKLRAIWLLVPVLLAGCSPQMADLQQYVAQVKQNTKPSIEPYPDFHKTPAFKYQAGSLRSPFQRPKGQVPEKVQVSKANCLQPDFSRAKEPLEHYGLDALKIKGFFTNHQGTWALIQANDGTLHQAKAGDHLGLFFGRINSISNGKVSITEMLPDGTGCWQKKQTTLTMSSTAGEQNNV